MIEETGTSGYEPTEEAETPVMEASVHRRRDEEDVTISGSGKRRRYDSEHEENVFQLQHRSRRDVDVNFREKVASNHLNSLFIMCNDDSISDLQVECVSETDIFISSNNSFSRETSASSVICFESEEMESLSSTVNNINNNNNNNNNSNTLTVEATSRRETAAVVMPSAAVLAELDEFFSKVEKDEQKRFAEKYNFDFVKGVPMEGRYEWVKLNP